MAKIKQLSQYWLWGIIILGVGGLSAALGMGTVVAWQVFLGDDTALRKTTILAKIKEETTLYYLDEKTRIGSFFESNHRRYISIDEVPPHVNNAIIAAEDKNFYRHFGIDPVALIKAIGEGVVSGGRFRRGGSTITQQTVKNIMDDWEASFSRKFREMIKAIQLERLYTKRQVLEFYLNQFHVAGNGNGIGIAAKYYFNKDVQDLTLVEGAFIAGSVKGPGKYNPFIKYTKKTRERAKAFANERKNYVLDRMLELGWIAKEEHDDAIKTDVPFNQGEFRSAEVSLVDLVRSQLKKKEVLEALNIKSIRDLNVAGMRVYTTIDLDMQKAAQLAMRRNLSRLDTILKGFISEDKEEFKPLRKLKLNEFYYGKVEAIEGTKPENMSIKLSFGFPKGVIPTESLIRYAKLLDLPIGNPRGWKHYMEEMKKTIKVGDVLYVEVMDYDSETNDAVLEFRKRPDISGGLIAIDKGEVRAVVSGFDTLGFNRAMHAKRPPGSVFKSVVFFAAMQLGWTVLDQVNNSRQIFPFQGQFYYPRPDHASPYRKASILWSGTMSENLSSVALTYRLVEKLNFEQFKELMGFMGYLPKLGESSRDFHYRVSKATGVSIDNKGIEEFQLKNAVNDIAPDLVFSGTQKLLNYLERMWLGEGYTAELKNLNGFDRKKFSLREYRIRRNLVKNNFRRYKRLADDLSSNWKALEGFLKKMKLKLLFQIQKFKKF
ncbi:MAG: transglycosylase domain-containing protein [Bdellovibrionota bacterium]